MSLFIGQKQVEVYSKLKQNLKCQYQLDIQVDKVFNKKALSVKMSRIYSLLENLDDYIERNIALFGNIICAVCNPHRQPYFKLESDLIRIQSRMSFCKDILDNVEFEVRLAKVFYNFIRPLY